MAEVPTAVMVARRLGLVTPARRAVRINLGEQRVLARHADDPALHLHGVHEEPRDSDRCMCAESRHQAGLAPAREAPLPSMPHVTLTPAQIEALEFSARAGSPAIGPARKD